MTQKSITFLSLLDNPQTIVKVKAKPTVSIQTTGPQFKENVTAYRLLFPAGMLPSGVAGRAPVPELMDKFTTFFKIFPEYSWELILEVTKKYVETYEAASYMYMKNAAYFIMKADKYQKFTYELASRCDINDTAPATTNEYYAVTRR